MADINRARTPEPPSFIRTPPTPRHAGDYQPFNLRKSSRISAQRSAHTPPPPSTTYHKFSTASATTSTPNINRSTRTAHIASPPSTIAKRYTSHNMSTITDPSSSTSNMGGSVSKLDLSRSTLTRAQGMLPTPDKTPKKRPSKPATGITSIARTLFPVRPETVDEVMPSPTKARKHYRLSAISSILDDDEDEDPPIQVYTDSHDRIPELDEREDNPFLHAQPPSPPMRKVSKRLKVEIPGEGDVSLEEAQKRQDGLIYVFRGKKIFRKFAADSQNGSQLGADDTDDEVEAVLDEASTSSHTRRQVSRTKLKPRLLFPSVEQAAARAPRATLHRVMSSQEEEEADTDIEEPADMNDLTTDIDTDTDIDIEHSPTMQQELQQTPKAPRFAPASPPTTLRTTRSKHVSVDMPSKNKTSPFDSWRRTKSTSTPPTSGSKKREGEALSSASSSPKRLRSAH